MEMIKEILHNFLNNSFKIMLMVQCLVIGWIVSQPHFTHHLFLHYVPSVTWDLYVWCCNQKLCRGAKLHKMSIST